jgi:predicted ATP-grasp superfamily ATP-dependent carboligase
MAYMDMIDQPIHDIKKEDKKITKWLFFFEDIKAAVTNITKKELSIRQWLASYHGDIQYAIFTTDDPLPFFTFCCTLPFTASLTFIRYLKSKLTGL